MKKYIPVIITVAGTISAAVAFPSWVAAHATAFASLNVVAQVLHAVLPSVFGTTQQGN